MLSTECEYALLYMFPELLLRDGHMTLAILLQSYCRWGVIVAMATGME